jgi:23S rRNA G2445 N2-methylase RlmL
VTEYVSTFTTGFGEIAAQALPSLLPGASVLRVHDGLIYYAYAGDPSDINQVPFFNNSFYVLRFFEGDKLSFHRMVIEDKLRVPIAEGTFRVRFSQSNRFVKVDRQIARRTENAIMKSSRLKLDRLNPSTEFWYVIRDEGFGFYGQLLQKRAAKEKNLHQGELRPEFACLMCLLGNPARESVILDPFAGYGAIPAQIAKHFDVKRLIANDIDPGKAQPMREDALHLTSVADAGVDLIITDPPWGYYEGIDDIGQFYRDMLREFIRVLKRNGRAVVLSARKEEFAGAVESTGAFAIEQVIHTLVNVKKAGVYVLNKNEV